VFTPPPTVRPSFQSPHAADAYSWLPATTAMRPPLPAIELYVAEYPDAPLPPFAARLPVEYPRAPAVIQMLPPPAYR